MERVANNPEDGQKEILFSHAQVKRFRENYICSCSSKSFRCVLLSKKIYQQTEIRVSQKYMHASTLILYAYQLVLGVKCIPSN